jgi:hypothetical protein
MDKVSQNVSGVLLVTITDYNSCDAENLTGCAIVMAHPDDEVLWASSLLDVASKVILCYGDLPGQPVFSNGRRKAVEALPLNGLENLNLTEACMFDHATWPSPEEIAEGLAPRRLPLGMHGAVMASYKSNYARLCNLLEHRLAGVSDVVTHNPWGEYGHEDHVQVFRAVEAVQKQLAFRIWVTGYASEKSITLMQRHLFRLGAPTQPFKTNKSLSNRLRQIYIENGCWTWSQLYAWPDTEWFFPLESNSEIVTQIAPYAVQHVHINMIQLNWTAPEKAFHIMKCWARHLKYRVVQFFPEVGRVLEAIKK